MFTELPRNTLARLLLGSASLLTACGGSHTSGNAHQQSESIAECDSFVAGYERCLRTLGPAEIARARAEQTRVALTPTSTATDEARSALRRQCQQNLAQLESSCR